MAAFTASRRLQPWQPLSTPGPKDARLENPAETLDQLLRSANNLLLRRPLKSAQYTSLTFGGRCREAGARASMGLVGDAYDNAMCESFLSTPEFELLSRRRFALQAKPRSPASATLQRSAIRLACTLGLDTNHQSLTNSGIAKNRHVSVTTKADKPFTKDDGVVIVQTRAKSLLRRR
jgi:transposase InsO family protein